MIEAISSVATDEALLVGRYKDHNFRRSELARTDGVVGMKWLMERLIEVVRRLNREQFDFDQREFSKCPLVSIYKASNSGRFSWHSDIGGGPAS